MKKVVVFFVLVLILSLSFISASVFSDFFGKITGKAIGDGEVRRWPGYDLECVDFKDVYGDNAFWTLAELGFRNCNDLDSYGIKNNLNWDVYCQGGHGATHYRGVYGACSDDGTFGGNYAACYSFKSAGTSCPGGTCNGVGTCVLKPIPVAPTLTLNPITPNPITIGETYTATWNSISGANHYEFSTKLNGAILGEEWVYLTNTNSLVNYPTDGWEAGSYNFKVRACSTAASPCDSSVLATSSWVGLVVNAPSTSPTTPLPTTLSRAPGITTNGWGYILPAGLSTWGEISLHGRCREYKNTGSNNYFIPTKTSAEWSAFINSASGLPGIGTSRIDIC